MYWPGPTEDEVAAHRTGRAPPAADCPNVEPAILPSLRRTRLLPRAAPLPARLLRVQPGWAASACVGRAAACRRRLSSAVKSRLASLELPYETHVLSKAAPATSSG